MSLFWAMVIVALAFVLAFETDALESGIAAGEPSQSEIILTYVVELATIAIIPLALRLFKFQGVASDLQRRHHEALRKWGVLRLMMLGFLLLANTLLYYVYLNTSFGYLAIMTALCLPFVYPSEGKCEAEAYMDAGEGEAV